MGSLIGWVHWWVGVVDWMGSIAELVGGGVIDWMSHWWMGSLAELVFKKWNIGEWGSLVNESLVEWGHWLNGSIDWMGIISEWVIGWMGSLTKWEHWLNGDSESLVDWVLSFQTFCTFCGQLVKIATHKEWTWSSKPTSILVFCKVLRSHYSFHVTVFIFYIHYKLGLTLSFTVTLNCHTTWR